MEYQKLLEIARRLARKVRLQQQLIEAQSELIKIQKKEIDHLEKWLNFYEMEECHKITSYEEDNV